MSPLIIVVFVLLPTVVVTSTWTMTSTTENSNITEDLSLENQTDVIQLTSTRRRNPRGPGLGYQKDYVVAAKINNKSLYVIAAVGFLGNSLVIITVMGMRPITSALVWVAFLALFDTGTLVTKLTYFFLTKNQVDMGEAGCKVLIVFTDTVSYVAIWIVVSMTIERFFAIWFPFKVAELSTVKRTCIAICVLFAIMFAVNMQFFWIITSVYNPRFSRHYCTTKAEHDEYLQKIWYWVNGCIVAVVPCFLLIILNTLIIHGMRSSAEKTTAKSEGSSGDAMSERRKQQRHVTVMLATVSVCFVCLLLPQALFYFVVTGWDYEVDNYQLARYYLIRESVLLIYYSNHAINFALYFFSGRRFRNAFLELFCCCVPKRKKTAKQTFITGLTSQSAPSQTT